MAQTCPLDISKYKFDDSNFGIPMLVQLTNELMAHNKTSPHHGVSILSTVSHRWTDIYLVNASKSSTEKMEILIELILEVINEHTVVPKRKINYASIASLFITCVIWIVSMCSIGLKTIKDDYVAIYRSSTRVGAEIIRQQKMGFDQTLSTQLSSTIFIVFSTLVILIFLYITYLIIDVVVYLLIFIFKFIFKCLIAFVKYAYRCKLFKILIKIILFPYTRICKYLRERAEYRKMITIDDSEEIPVITRTTSDVSTDEFGAYLTASDRHRVYVGLNHVDTLYRFPFNDRVNVEGGKEAVLAGSKFYKAEKMPKFQGQFKVGNVVVGHFSRIMYKGADCLLTAYHVLEYNRSAMLWLHHLDNKVRFDSIKSRVVCGSPTNSLDYVIIEIPASAFTQLAMGVGKFCNRIHARQPVSIFQLYENQLGVTQSTIALSKDKVWHIEYSASTLPGSSGAPILNVRQEIIGVHLEHNCDSRLNCGVIPPSLHCIRKESPQNDELMQAEPDEYDYDFLDYDDDDFTREERGYDIEDNAERSRKWREENEEFIIGYVPRSDRAGRNWAEELDEFEEYMSEQHGVQADDSEFQVSFRAVKNTRPKTRPLNLMRRRKESPWTCSKCACVHILYAYNCSKCGAVIENPTPEKVEQVKQERRQAVAQSIPQFPEISDLIVKHLNQYWESEGFQTLISKAICKNLALDEELHRRCKQDRSIYSNGFPVKGPVPTIEMDKKSLQSLRTRSISRSYHQEPRIAAREILICDDSHEKLPAKRTTAVYHGDPKVTIPHSFPAQITAEPRLPGNEYGGTATPWRKDESPTPKNFSAGIPPCVEGCSKTALVHDAKIWKVYDTEDGVHKSKQPIAQTLSFVEPVKPLNKAAKNRLMKETVPMDQKDNINVPQDLITDVVNVPLNPIAPAQAGGPMKTPQATQSSALTSNSKKRKRGSRTSAMKLGTLIADLVKLKEQLTPIVGTKPVDSTQDLTSTRGRPEAPKLRKSVSDSKSTPT
nr:proteinase [Sobelivirales sp.]